MLTSAQSLGTETWTSGSVGDAQGVGQVVSLLSGARTRHTY
jgi:hypothetical protein